jgi:hypothetical protein
MSVKWQLYHMIFDDVSLDEIWSKDVVVAGKKASPPPKIGPLGKLAPLSCLDPIHPACKYVRSRGYETAWLHANYKVCYCAEAESQYQMATGRIVIPIYMHGNLVGWQARYLGKPPNKYTPRYWTCPGMPKGQYLYNFDVARKYPYVVVVEGGTGVWRGGAIFCMLDGSAQDENQALFDMLKVGPTRVVRIDLPHDKDPDSCTTDYLRNLVAQAAALQGMNLAFFTKQPV